MESLNIEDNNVNKLIIYKENENVKTPVRGSEFAAGYDIFADEETIIKPWDK